MRKSYRLEKDKKKTEDNIIKYVISLFRLQKEIDGTTIKDKKHLFRLKKDK